MKKTTEDWIQAAEDDIAVINHIINDNALTHIVAFHAQQAIEKAIKAIIEEYELGNVKSHSLENLLGIVQNHITIKTGKQVISSLESLYIESRYPGSLGMLPQGKPTIAEVSLFHNEAIDVIQQVKNHLSSKLT
jgi:HEPN domain-containing protein